ncbi:MAG: lipopolysaccharide biosynthesis protein, partial [Erythrobacter sp.]
MAILSTIILARLLTPEDFGIVALGTTIMVIISSVTEMSMANALIHHDDPTDQHLQTAWTLGVARGVALAAIMAVGAAPFAKIYGDPRLELVMYAFAFSILASGFLNPRQAMLTRDLKFHQEFLLLVTSKLVTAALSIGLAIAWETYWAMIVGTLAGQIVTIGLSYALLPFRPRFNWQHTRELFSFSVWLTFGQAMNTINWRFDQLLVGGVLGTGALGHYSVGSNLAQVPTREISNPLKTTLFPALARLKHEPDRLRFAYQRAQSLIVMIALPMGIGLALIARDVVTLTMGEDWLPAVPVIQALSSVFALQTLGSLIQPLGMGLGHTKLLFVRDTQMLFIRLPIIIAGTLWFGLIGLVYSRVLSGMIGLFIQMALVRKMTKLSVQSQLSVNWRSLSAAAFMAVAVTLYQSLSPTVGTGAINLIIGITKSICLGAFTYTTTTA